jgi:hypothetical protein
MRSYELADKVSVELWMAGERLSFSGGPGVVKPKNEGEELCLEHLLDVRPDVAKRKATTTKKAEE